MLIGAHASVWAGAFDKKGVEKTIQSASSIGYDLVEFPLMDVDGFAHETAKKLLAERNMACTASLGLTRETDISSTDAQVVEAGRVSLMKAVDLLAAIGGTHLCGVLASAMTKYDAPSSAQGRENSQRVLAEVAHHAADAGIRISLEVVNRYETNLFNTGADCREFIEEGALENVGIHLDTYHMNIEETDMWTPFVNCREQLGYVHIGESNRGYLGSGNVDFDAVFGALDLIQYDGIMVFESFSSAVVSKELSNTLGVWRNLWDDSDDLARHALDYMRGRLNGLRANNTAIARGRNRV